MSVQTPNARAIFERALELTNDADRQAYLDEFFSGHPELRDKVQALLRAHGDAGSFLAVPALEAQQTHHFAPIAERPGTIIGPYKLLEQIGEGGFGVVFMAEQERPVSRRVALKVIKPGMDTRQVIARFEAERQALALMDHPNIAKVLEAGATESGRPYFVMELVRGIPITEFCDKHCLSVQERLKLFISVCHAVQHAHQKGIIHRDLKPTNVLVTLHDGKPVAKVIDFGVAKATGQRLTDRTLFTAFSQMVGTPLYMSPEQAEMSGLDVDTRSDIYSLGVLLYELLTGTTPFDKVRLREAAFDEIRRIIRLEEPPKPSTRISTQGVAASTISTQRQSEPDKLRRLVRGDLDWIVMKCLEKDRNRRYETANGLAADLERHLENEPVLARPPSTVYKFRKAWQRNKVICTAGVAVFLALTAGLTLAALGWMQAVTERDSAVTARAGEAAARSNEAEQRMSAEAATRRAEQQEEEMRHRAYAAEISSAFQALNENNLGRAIELLDRQRPMPGEEDLRGFEWRHLWQLCQSDEKATFRDMNGSALALSPDGRWMAQGGDQIVIRELPSQALVATIPDAAMSLAFSPNGKLLASGNDLHVRLWSTESWQEVHSPPDARCPAVFSPDGQWLVTGTPGGYRDGKWLATVEGGGYLVWRQPEGTRSWERNGYCPGGPKENWQSLHGVAFSPDGKLLVTAGHPTGQAVPQFQVWDFPALTARTNFESFPFKLGSVGFAPDGKHLLIGDWYGGLMVWDVSAGRVVDTLHEHTGGITTITPARDGQTFATSSCDRTVILWDAQTRKVLVRLRGHIEEVWSVAISPDGKMLASRSHPGTTKLWDTNTRHERRMLPRCGIVVGFSADSRLLLLRGLTDHRLWRRADGAVTKVPFDPLTDHRGMDTWSDVHGVEPHAAFGQEDGTLEFWNLATMSRVTSWRVSEAAVSTAALSPDRQYVATSDAHGDVKLWEIATQREVRRFSSLGERMMSVIFSPDGRLLAGSASCCQRVGIWDVNSGRLLQELPMQDSGLVPSLAFSPDGTLLATAQYNNQARLWEIPSGKLRATLEGHIQAVMGVAYSPDGRTLATGGDDGKVKLWNIATQQEMTSLEIPHGGCRSIKFSPDGCALAVGSFLDPEPYMWLWEAPSFEEIAAAEAKRTAANHRP
jgi:WD40 repeat protein/serine/threonine protein kinase